MFRPLEFFIGLRYTRAKRRNHFISFISLVSILGIAVGVTALITVISVMNGFDRELKDRILGMVAHATVEGVDESVRDWPQALARAERNPHVLGAAPYVEREAMLQGQRVSGAIVRGVLPEYEPHVSEIDRKMVVGKLDDLSAGSFNIILGRELAMKLGVSVGDHATLITPEVSTSPMGVQPRFKRFTVSGIFEVGMQEYDGALAVVHMKDAQTLYRLDGPSGIRLRLDDMFRAWSVARELSGQLGQAYRVSDWMQGHSNFFKAIAMEKKVMFLILSLIVAVAAFNLVSTLVMLVTDKQADIAILRTLGQSPRSIMGVFMVQGVLVGTLGIALGVLFGVLLAANLPEIVRWIEQAFGVSFLSADVYYISEVPSQLEWSDVSWITLTAFLFCIIATLYPAWRAARIEPAAALRYE
ncbi:MAG: lipoprotein-releasing ABC transporter permease subunit [Dokdonella sp.]|uniref:lipoprotein-releasing ABC transporter permease subunit n=2 Tax=Dokdonella sp. TaxID=2291710 RepID=UPI001B5EAB4D|nr:lipoprotein-releasing ABC transporter permease subunit [Dokdonella sp.]MBK8122163.1 lipoprotein-releasing ABC transporter permease subunit [Dokdonella sp.]MBP6326737.1 lipoprotein-releasing ABC transporter permease subunit [Dokdonella sp.]HNV07228.1 lipoprotein-releasing ABC transporter permease subunit [Dokdonella sp.]HPW04114.1 lipoprotein-releasing ABC transporter permease subunit [Dokdonella sp.]